MDELGLHTLIPLLILLNTRQSLWNYNLLRSPTSVRVLASIDTQPWTPIYNEDITWPHQPIKPPPISPHNITMKKEEQNTDRTKWSKQRNLGGNLNKKATVKTDLLQVWTFSVFNLIKGMKTLMFEKCNIWFNVNVDLFLLRIIITIR